MIFQLKQYHWLWISVSVLSFGLAVMLTPARAVQPDPSSLNASPTAEIAPFPVVQELEQGRTLYQAGRFEEAATNWRSAIQQYQQRGDQLHQALSLSYLSLAYQQLSRWEAAQQAIDQSLSLLKTAKPKAGKILWAQVLNTQARLQRYTGQAETALTTWQQAQRFYEEAGDPVGSLGSQINQAKALQTLGFYRRSRQRLEALAQTLATMPDSEMKLSGLHSLGLALYANGDTTKSQPILQQSLTIATTLPAKSYISSILVSLGKVSAELEDPQAALNYFNQAEKAAINPREQLQARLERFYLFLAHNRWELAKPIAPQLLKQLQGIPPSRASLYTAINFVAILNRLESPTPMLSLPDLARLMAKTTQAAQQIQDLQVEAYAFYQWGQLYQRTEQWTEAIQLFQKSLEIARQLRSQEIIAQAAWRLGQSYRQTGKIKDAIAAYQVAVNALQSLRADLAVINPAMQFSFGGNIEPVYRGLVGLLLEQDPNPSQDTLAKALSLVNALQVAELDHFFQEACVDSQQQPDFTDPNATIVYPVILPDRLMVIVSNPGQPLRHYTTPLPRQNLETTSKQLLVGLHPVSDAKKRDRAAQQLYDWLIRPAEVDQAFKNTKTLVFVLDGKLRNIPLAALYDGQHYLIEKYAIALSPGLQLMKARQFQNRQLDAIVGGISKSHEGFSALPAVESEVRQIADTVPSTLLINQEFTSIALASRVKNSNANIVHLATHGQFSSQQEGTFLLTWDGRISIKELAELLKSRRRNPSNAIDLLVLSACDTAVGDDRAVLGLAGLAVKSGARSTIATLWPVKDKAAELLMTSLYHYLQQPGMAKAEALRQAQLQLIQKTDFKDPFFWSAFVLVGDWL